MEKLKDRTVLVKRSISDKPKKDGVYIACRSTWAPALWVFRRGSWIDDAEGLPGKVVNDIEYWYEEVKVSELIEGVMPSDDERQLQRMRIGDQYHRDKPNGIYVALRKYDEWIKTQLSTTSDKQTGE